MDKKAVSVMISYVILIAIAIAVSMGIYSWLRIIASDVKPEINCEEGTTLTLMGYSFAYENFTIDVKNNGRFNISGFILTVSNESGKPPTMILLGGEVYQGYYYFLDPLRPGEEKKSINFSNETTRGYRINISEIKKIRIQPFIQDKSDLRVCKNSILVQEIIFVLGSGGGSIGGGSQGAPPGGFIIESMEGLVSWWRLNGSLEDYIGDNDDGVFGGSPIYVTGVEGEALNFNGYGTGDYVELEKTFTLDKLSSAVSLWIKPGIVISSNYDDRGHFLGQESDTVSFIGLKNSSSSGVIVSESDTGGDIWASYDLGYYPTDWIHVVLNANDSNISLYINSSIKSSTIASNNITIGYFAQGDSETRYNGTVDEVLVFNRTLTPDEIDDIYQELKPW